jgi:hypothetical protein
MKDYIVRILARKPVLPSHSALELDFNGFHDRRSRGILAISLVFVGAGYSALQNRGLLNRSSPRP